MEEGEQIVAKPTQEPKITRIKATDSGSKKTKKVTPKKTPNVEVRAPKQAAANQPKLEPAKEHQPNFFQRLGEYFKGSWQELKLVHWPDRPATWKMTGALIAFTLAFVVLILLFDYAFEQLFKVLIMK